MPEDHQSDDWGALAYRVRLLEDRAQEDRRAMNAALDQSRREHDAVIHQLRGALREDYLTRDQIAVAYASRTEMSRASAVRREWPLILFGAILAMTGVIDTILLMVGK